MSGKILVFEILSKNWSKWGQNGAFRDFLENSSFVFLDIVHVDRGQYCASFGENRMSGKILVLEILGKKWSKRDQKGLFLIFLENSSFVFLDIVHVDRGQ